MIENKKVFPPKFGSCFVDWQYYFDLSKIDIVLITNCRTNLSLGDVGSYPELIGKTTTFAYCQDDFGEGFTTVANGCLISKVKTEEKCKDNEG